MANNSAVCTLFEGHYHLGVAALINSLHKNGYQGRVYIGYRGQLSDWCQQAVPDTTLQWTNARTLVLNPAITIHFLPVDTTYHLTNYKPEFMVRLINGVASQCDNIAYFDPDIVLKCPWSFIETWMGHGVALVHEVVMNDMPRTHPIRMEWKKIIHENGRTVKNDLSAYLNGGFCGVSKENFDFLTLWANLIKLTVDVYGQNPAEFASFSRTSAFWNIDQDTFNITAMCCDVPISEAGPEAMDFVHGGQVMSHAVGSPKPWKKKYLLSAVKGVPPSLAEKEFWYNVEGAIPVYNSNYFKRKKLAVAVSSLIGRFYRRA